MSIIVNTDNAKGVVPKLDFIAISNENGKKNSKLDIDKLASSLKVSPQFLTGMLIRSDKKPVKIVSPEWFTECFKANALVDSSKLELEVSKPQRGSSKSNEEEKKDKVVSMDEIMNDVYDMKFGNKKRRNPPKDMKEDDSESFVEGKRKIKSKTFENELMTMKSDIKSKHYVDGEEVFSEDSYLFKWKPDFIEKNEGFWDAKKDKFACNRSSTKKNLEEDKEESKGEV
jgi:hypothetical protein